MSIKVKIKINEHEKEVRYPESVYTIMRSLLKDVKQHLDGVIIITGEVGSGKTNIAKGLSGLWESFFDRNYNLDQVHFTAESLVKFTDLEDNMTEVCHFDESIQGGSGRDVITNEGNMLKITLITKRRKRHLYIFIVDTIKELSKKIIERAKLLIYTKYYRLKNGDIERGRSFLIGPKTLRTIYNMLKKNEIFHIEQYNRFSSFHKVKFPCYENIWFDEKEYDQKKAEQTKMILADSKSNSILEQRNKLIIALLKRGMKQHEVASMIDLDRGSIAHIKAKMKTKKVAP